MGTGGRGALITEFIAHSRALEPGEFERTPTISRRRNGPADFHGTPLDPQKMLETIKKYDAWASRKWGSEKKAPAGLRYDIAKRISHSTLLRELGVPKVEWSHLVSIFGSRFNPRPGASNWKPVLDYFKAFGKEHAVARLDQVDEAASEAREGYRAMIFEMERNGPDAAPDSSDMFSNALFSISWKNRFLKDMLDDPRSGLIQARGEPPAHRRRLLAFLRSHHGPGFGRRQE
ncbi:MAG: hypothetical protein V1787_06535 [Candidatus Micrarchaeota archaeon]